MGSGHKSWKERDTAEFIAQEANALSPCCAISHRYFDPNRTNAALGYLLVIAVTRLCNEAFQFKHDCHFSTELPLICTQMSSKYVTLGHALYTGQVRVTPAIINSLVREAKATFKILGAELRIEKDLIIPIAFKKKRVLQ